MQNIPVIIEYCSLKQAQQKGALAFFGEKYKPENVRMVQVDDFSVELCGGTHVHATGDIGTFKITESVALSAGHRRIFAVTGPKAIDLFQETFNAVKALSQEYKVKREDVLEAIEKQKEQLKTVQQELKSTRQQLMFLQIPQMLQSVELIKDVPFLCVYDVGMSAEDMRTLATMLEQKQPGFYVIYNHGLHHEPVSFYAVVSAQFAHIIDMKQFGAWLQTQGLRGGGAKNSIQGGGEKFNPQLANAIKQWMQER